MITAWILDVTSAPGGLTLWLKRSSGEVIPVQCLFQPRFYAAPARSNPQSIEEIQRAVEAHPHVASTGIVPRFVHIRDQTPQSVVEAAVDSPRNFQRVIRDVKSLEIADLFNIDLPIAQMFFYETGLFPFARMRVDLRTRGNWFEVARWQLADDNEALEYPLPPLKIAWLDVVTRSGSPRPSVDDPVTEVRLACKTALVERGEWPFDAEWEDVTVCGTTERDTLESISSALGRLDPDFLLTRGGDEFGLPHLLSRAARLGIGDAINLSRTQQPLLRCRFAVGGDDPSFFSYGHIIRRAPTQFYLTGRVHIDTTTHGSLHFADGNIPGVIEVARVSYVPAQRLTRVTIGGALQSIQFANAYHRGLLIPPEKKNAEDFRDALGLVAADKGGHYFEPSIGVFGDVAELDFVSMYPALMREYNVSPETVNCACCADGSGIPVPEIGFHTCRKKVGLIPESLRVPLAKRIAYKKLSRELGAKGKGKRYAYMEAALKWVLVVSFGYLGFKNARFGRVEAHQAVCAFSREFLLRAAELARVRSFHLLHGIVDSLWLQREDAGGANGMGAGQQRNPVSDPIFDTDCRALCEDIYQATRLRINYDARYKFIVFMPSRVSPRVPTLNHYWGVTWGGEIKVRGVEVRRHDAPKIIQQAQQEMMEAFARAPDANHFYAWIPEVQMVVQQYIRRIRSGNCTPEELAVTTHVSRHPNEYKVDSYQAVAAKQLEVLGRGPGPGEKVSYVITNAAAAEGRKRVVILDHFTGRYDKEKYVELLVRAFQNLVPVDLGLWRREHKAKKAPGLDPFFQNN